jgi:hypothetical protein
VDSEEIVKTNWCIDFDWYQPNNRSFLAIAQDCLCPKCRQRLKADEKEVSAANLLKAVQSCCSREPGFITGTTPVLESIFRLFLAGGNQPLDMHELGKQLSDWRGGDTYRTSANILSRLLTSNQYYGIRQVAV